jgi:hypothetical protein
MQAVPWFTMRRTTRFLEEDPPIAVTYAAFGGNSNQVSSALFALLGRRYTVGVRFGF